MDKFEKKMKEALHEVTNGFEVSDEIKERIKKLRRQKLICHWKSLRNKHKLIGKMPFIFLVLRIF